MSKNAGMYQQSSDHINLINIDQVSYSLPSHVLVMERAEKDELEWLL
jgi:hypothetical protein